MEYFNQLVRNSKKALKPWSPGLFAKGNSAAGIQLLALLSIKTVASNF